jgi:hypothetical protein
VPIQAVRWGAPLNFTLAVKQVMKRAFMVGLPILLFATSALGECAAEAPSDATTLVRRHEVRNFNGDAPVWLEDELEMWLTGAGEMCFTLRTVGPNAHECGAEGSLETVAKGHYRFGADVCVIDFSVQRGFIELRVADTWRRTGEGGICPKRFERGMFGAIHSGRFLPRDKNPLRAAPVPVANKPLVPTRTGEAPVLAAQRRR